ncbi:MAG: hypothetical protein IH968_06555 [Gemmatimonadetes bacterium]|nr:hypothetical protein [Gemmatimonadota bacterium]
MARVLPSQAVGFIVAAFPWVEVPDQQKKTVVGIVQKAQVAALVDLVDEIPGELLVLEDSDYVGFRVVLSELRSMLVEWERYNRLGGAPGLRGGDLYDGYNPVAYLYHLLRKCPDEVAAADEHGLEFVLEPDLRRGILVDLGAIQRSLSNSEWKAATVLAGSVIEALLLDTLLSLDGQHKDVAKRAADDIGKPAPADYNDWGLAQYIAGAKAVDLITATTAASCKLAKDFRHLIHPGRELRLATPCNRGTAYIAVGALERVMSDLSQQPAGE